MELIDYTLVEDYLLPNLALSDPHGAPPLGRYGTMHKEYLREHRPILYSKLLLTEKLYPLCREIDEAAKSRLHQYQTVKRHMKSYSQNWSISKP